MFSFGIASLLVGPNIYDQIGGSQSTSEKELNSEVHWQIEKTQKEWVDENIDKSFIKGHKVLAIFSVTHDTIEAWKPNGEPYNDFAAYVRVRLEGKLAIKFPLVFGQKTRVVVIRTPQKRDLVVSTPETSLNLSNADSDTLNNEFRVGINGSRDYFICLSVPKNARTVDLPVTAQVGAFISEVPIKAGTKFELAGGKYEITSVKPFSNSQLEQSYLYGWQKFYSVVSLKSSPGSPTLSSAGVLGKIDPNKASGNRYIDERGNYVMDQQSSTLVARNLATPMLQSYGFKKDGADLLFGTVNPKYLDFATFSHSESVKLTLMNVPMEPSSK